VQFLDRQVPITLGKEQVAKRDALARRPEAGAPQPCFNRSEGLQRTINKLQLI
jgi:hypothetical protein